MYSLSFAWWIANAIAVIVKDVSHTWGGLGLVANAIAIVIVNTISWVVVKGAILIIQWWIVVIQRRVVVVKRAIVVIQGRVIPASYLGMAANGNEKGAYKK